MTIELMELIIEKIGDIEIVKKVFKILEKECEKNIISLLDKLEKSNNNEYVYKISMDSGIEILNRITLLEVLEECDYNEYACKIAINKDIEFNDKIKLINALRECNYDFASYMIAMHTNNTLGTKIQLMIKYKGKLNTNFKNNYENIKNKNIAFDDIISQIDSVFDLKEYLSELKKEYGNLDIKTNVLRD